MFPAKPTLLNKHEIPKHLPPGSPPRLRTGRSSLSVLVLGLGSPPAPAEADFPWDAENTERRTRNNGISQSDMYQMYAYSKKEVGDFLESTVLDIWNFRLKDRYVKEGRIKLKDLN